MQQGAVDRALGYLEQAKRELLESGEPALAMALSSLLTRVELTNNYVPPMDVTTIRRFP
jgi:hypothetical protein